MIVEAKEDVVILSGNIDHNYSEAMNAALAITLQHHPSGVIVDCSQLTGINNEGVETLQQAIEFVLDHESARIIFAKVPDTIEETMRHCPEIRSQMAVSQSVLEARKSIDAIPANCQNGNGSTCQHTSQILLCQCPTLADEHILDVTYDLVDTASTKIILLIPITVPRALPLQAPMPELEEKARQFIEKATTHFQKLELPVEVRLERTRDFSSLIAEMVEEVNASRVLVGLDSHDNKRKEVCTLMDKIMSKVNRPLLFIRKQTEDN